MISTRPPRKIQSILDDSGTETVTEEIDGPLVSEVQRRVLAMGVPSVAGFLLLTIYDLIDIFWLARIGEEAVAAVTMFSALQWVLGFANAIIGSGSVAIISRRFGEGDMARTADSIKNTFLAKFLVGFVFGGIGIGILGPALTFMGAEPLVRDLGVEYGVIQCLVLGVSLASFSVYTAFRGIGNPKLGLWMSAAGTLVNLTLDPLLIFGIGPFPEMGVQGASLASALGFLTVTIWGCVALASPRSPARVNWFSLRGVNREEIFQFFRIGAPAGVSSLSFALFGFVVVKLVAMYGTTVVALFGMSQKVLRFGTMVLGGLGLGQGALVGQYLGSRHLHRAWLSSVLALRAGAISMVAFGVLVALFARQIVPFFFPDPAAIDEGARYLRVLVLGLPFLGVVFATEHAYSGAGRNLPPMYMHMITSWVLTIPLMWILGETLGFGPLGMMVGTAIGNLMGAVIAIFLLRHGTWLLHRV